MVDLLLLLLALKMVLRLLLVVSERGRRLLGTHKLFFSLFAFLVLDSLFLLLEPSLFGLKALDFAPILLVLTPLGLELEPILLLDLLLERTLDFHLLLKLVASFAVVVTTTATRNSRSSESTARWIGSETSAVLLRLVVLRLVLVKLLLVMLVLVKVLGDSLFLLVLLLLLLWKVSVVLTLTKPKLWRLQWSTPVTQPRVLLLAWKLLRLSEELRVAVSLVYKVRIETPTAEMLVLLLRLESVIVVVVVELELVSRLRVPLRRIVKSLGRHLLRLVVLRRQLALTSRKVLPVRVVFLAKPIKEPLASSVGTRVMKALMTWTSMTRTLTFNIPVALFLQLTLLHLLGQRLRVRLLPAPLLLLLARGDGIHHASLSVVMLLLASHRMPRALESINTTSQGRDYLTKPLRCSK